MNPTQTSVRMASLAAAAFLTLAVVVSLSESLHIDRLAQTPPVVALEAVTVRPHGVPQVEVTAVADAADQKLAPTRTN